MKGYPGIIIIKMNLRVNIINKIDKEMEIEPNKEYYFNDDNLKKDYQEIIEKLNNILSDLESWQINAYENMPLLRFIYGRQFNLIYNHLNKKDKNIIHLLKYITNDLYKKKIDNFIPQEDGLTIQNFINNCEKYLNEVLKINNLDLRKIYETTIIRQKYIGKKYQGIYTYLFEELEKELFQIYKYLTGNNPIAQNILLCNKDTSKEEIISFLYRAIKCEFESCFIVGGIEILDNKQKITVLDLLNHFFPKGDEEINSCVIFLYSNKNSDIYRNMEMKKYRKIFDIKRNAFESLKYKENNIEIIKSDNSGVGKSTQIKIDIEKCKKKYIYFPVGEKIIHEEIIEKLKYLKIDNNCILHLDLYNTDQIELMKEFLFSILINRFYGKNEDIFFLSKDISIKVEIPNTFIDFLETFKFLSLFPIKEIKILDLAPLIVPNNLDSNIQLVSNYLKAIEEDKLNNFDLIFPNITPNDFRDRFYLINNNKYSTSVNAELLSQEECQKLIFNSIKRRNSKPNYYQIESFVKVLSNQLKKFNQNFYLSAYILLTNRCRNLCFIRRLIVECLIILTNYFTKGALGLIKFQNFVQKELSKQYDKEINQESILPIDMFPNENFISFDIIEPSLLFFHEGDGQLFSIITNKNKFVQEYNDLLSIKNSQTYTQNEIKHELPNYKKYNQIQFLQELKEILDINNPIEKGTDSNKISLEEIIGNYVITPDNFIKMVLILLRLRSNIPVIMMGETGCGKTSLIKKLSELKNNGDERKMKSLNIHAGMVDEDIIDFIHQHVIPEALEIKEYEKKMKEERNNCGQFFNETKVWVFLDNINTGKSMGLISELMLKHTCQGETLPSNVVFIAACYPYRQRIFKKNNYSNKFFINNVLEHKQIKYMKTKELKDIKRRNNNNLVYNVNPLPHSLLNFVLDFGYIKGYEEENYIKNIINQSINNKYYKGKEPEKDEYEDEEIKKLKKLASDMIKEAHNFIKEFNDISAVSLRDIRRFTIFYEFFYDYLIKKKEMYLHYYKCELDDDQYFYYKLDDYEIQVFGINLSIYICYYLKIKEKKRRYDLYIRMNELLKKFDKSFENIDFLYLPKKEELFITNNLKLSKDIVKNRTLITNLFSIFVSIYNKVPIFVIGEPGYSKSLSIQLIIKLMEGYSSKNYFFKNFPKLIVHSYYGSIFSTNKGIQNIFKNSQYLYSILNEEDKRKNIPLVFFDEIGLAEYSSYNPLSSILSELEDNKNYESNIYAFVGISNWILDAAIMNRGISLLIIGKEDESGIIETSLKIGKSFDEELAIRYEDFLKNLGRSFYEYKRYLITYHELSGKFDLFGNRDFYSLVKKSLRNMMEKEKSNELNDMSLLECGVDSIERNFSGIKIEYDKNSSLEIFKRIFQRMYPECQVVKEYDIIKRIKENINDLNSRYLLVFAKSSISTFLLSSILSNEKKEYNFFIGSQFEEDLFSEEYIVKVLNKIQVYMERGNILILKNLDSAYFSLYNLFNQNFIDMNNKRYIKLGLNTNSFYSVNKDFRLIITIDIESNEEVNFLNKFEKHILSFQNLLSNELIKEATKIKLILDEIVKCDEKKFKTIPYEFGKLLVNNSLEEVQGLLYEASKKGLNKEEMNEFVLSKFALTLPQDILINMKINDLKNKDKSFEKIIELYKKGEHSNFSNFLKTMKGYKNIIYTFSNNLEALKNIDYINNELIGIINKENIKEIIISSIKNENDLEREIDFFFNKKNYKICIIRLMPYEGSLMNYLKFFIENKEKNLVENNSKKVFIFIVYMTKILKEELKEIDKMPLNEQIEIRKKIIDESLSHLSGYYQIFIDNLNGNENKIEEILNMNKFELFITLDNIYDKNVQELKEVINKLKLDLKKEKEINNEKDLKIKELEEMLKKNEKDIDNVKDLKIKELEEMLKKNEKDIDNEKNLKIKELEETLKNMEKEIDKEKREKNDLIKTINDLKNNKSNKDNELKELMEKLKKMENEIKMLKEKIPFEYGKEDKIFTVTFLSQNEDIHYSMICKNTDNFQRLEKTFYDKFPEYQNCNNIFLINERKIDKNKNVETNGIIDNDIIIFKPEIDAGK